MELDKKFKLLKQAEMMLEVAITGVYEAACLLENELPDEKETNRMYSIRLLLGKKINDIKEHERKLRTGEHDHARCTLQSCKLCPTCEVHTHSIDELQRQTEKPRRERKEKDAN